MSLLLSPLQPSELPTFVQIQWDAFYPPEADMIYPMLYPRGMQPDLMERMSKRFLAKTDGNLASSCFCAKDPVTHDILGIAWWGVVHSSPRTKDEMDVAHEVAAKVRAHASPEEGANQELERAYFACSLYSEMEVMAGRGRYMTLRLLATDPKYQRRGTGSFLLKAGLEEADRLGLPVYLASGISGKTLYERVGFEVVREYDLDCRKYGGRSRGTHWSMVRPAKVSSEKHA